jgi:hypothetical protein
MATKEDILEQVVEEYLLHQGFFVRHNVKFLPRRNHIEFIASQDSNHSDIDVLGYHPHREGPDKVFVVSCKSWQGGFRPSHWIDAIQHHKKINGREAWKSFRELVAPKWSEAFIDAVRTATGTDRFTYVVAVAHVIGDKAVWENNAAFRQMLGGNPIRIIGFEEMVLDINAAMKTTLAATEVGRLLQMFRAAGLTPGIRADANENMTRPTHD